MIWTFLIGLLLIAAIDRAREHLRLAGAIAVSAGLVFLGFLLGYAVMSDYYGVGVLTVVVFYFFHKRTWKSFLGQFICLYILNVNLLGGYYYEVTIIGYEFEVIQQGLALLGLIPIWLYRGKQGFHHKIFRIFCYAFYPLHMLVLFWMRESAV